MTYTTSNEATSNVAPALLQSWQNLDVDQQLALFYFIYKEIGRSVTPAAPGASAASPEIAEGIFNQIKDLSQEEQLQLQRDLILQKNTPITREYGSLSNTTKLLLWYRLAQGMDSGEIIPMPDNYKLSGEAQQLLSQICALEFQQQITFFRDFVAPMGSSSTED
ncbi:MAG: Orange carotenoid protein [Scytolyngbya sp. HA4215-MV1]|jgi:hypothetical protein|nr:Orange carotenoid protein [Scytolyngbya sp. HA4215-MV1]